MKKLIAIRDIVADTTPFIGLANNEAQFVRDNLPLLMRMGLPTKDVQFQYIADYDDKTGEVKALPMLKVIPQDIYKREPEAKADKLDETTEKKLSGALNK